MAIGMRKERAWSIPAAQLSIGVLAGLCVCSMTGCYERVTRASGFGADQYQVSEPYQRNSAVDDWLFGKQAASKTTGSRIPPTPPRD